MRTGKEIQKVLAFVLQDNFPGEGGGSRSLNMVPWYASMYKKNNEKGRFLSQIGGVPGPQKGGIFAKKGRCLTEDTPVTIKGVLW